MNGFVEKISNLAFVRKFGDLNGFFKFLVVPVLIVALAVTMVVTSLTTSFSDVLAGRGVLYSPEQISQYAEEQYAEQFKALKDEEGFEECLLLVVFVDKADPYGEFYIQSRVGEKIEDEVFGIKPTGLTGSLNWYHGQDENRSFEECLSLTLASFRTAAKAGQTSIEAGAVESKFINNPTASTDEVETGEVETGEVEKDNELKFNEKEINKTLQSFTEKTGIPAVVVVADGNAAFASAITTRTVITFVLSAAMIAGAVFLVIKGLKDAKGAQKKA